MKAGGRAALLLVVASLGMARASRGEGEVAACGGLAFTEVAAASGIDFLHQRGGKGEMHLPETMGAGAAWLDYDGDGLVDLYLVQSGPYPPDASPAAANRLYRNLGDGRFADVTVRSGGGDRGCGQGATAADVDGDGDVDLYVTNIGADALWRNRGDGTLEEVTAAAGLGLDGWSSSAAFADVDGDGDLDLYVTRYLEYGPGHGIFCGDPKTGERSYCDPSLFAGATDRFYRNRGDGTFTEATAAAGLAPADGRGLGVVATDLDGDLHPEIYVANDLTLNFLFRNLGDGMFEDDSLVSGAAVNREGKPEAGMGIAVADVDGDLDPDLAVTNFDVETNTLYRNEGALFFTDVSASSGFGLPSFNLLAFGLAAADLDRDGDVDFFAADGHIFEQPKRENVTYRQRPLVLLGDGRGAFREARCPGALAREMVGRGLAVADYDDDGDPDLAIQDNGGPAVLLRNDVAAGGWLGLALAGRAPNTGAVGARAVLTTPRGPQVRWVLAGDSYQSSSEPRLLFGLEQGDLADGLEVTWPDGRRLRLASPPTGRYLVLYQTP